MTHPMTTSGLSQTTALAIQKAVSLVDSAPVDPSESLEFLSELEDLEFSDFGEHLGVKAATPVHMDSTALELAKNWSVGSHAVKVNAYSRLIAQCRILASTSFLSSEYDADHGLGKRTTIYNLDFDLDLFCPEKKRVSEKQQNYTPTADYLDFLEKCSTRSFCEIPDFDDIDALKEGMQTPTCDTISVVESISEQEIHPVTTERKRLIQQKLRNFVATGYSNKAAQELPQLLEVVEGFRSLASNLECRQ